MDATTGSVPQASSTGIQAGALSETMLCEAYEILDRLRNSREFNLYIDSESTYGQRVLGWIARYDEISAPEPCESGCGPATTVDDDGVPLCEACAKSLAEESAEEYRAAGAITALEEVCGETPGVVQSIEARYWLLVAAEDRARKAGETQIPFGNDKGVGRVPEDDLASPMPERVTVCGGMRPRTGWESDARPVLTCDQPIGHEVSTPELRHWNREHGESWPTTAQREALEARESEAAR